MGTETSEIFSELMGGSPVSTQILCEAGCPLVCFGIKVVRSALEAIQTLRGTQVFERPLEVTVKDLRDKFHELKAQITDEQYEEIRGAILGAICYVHLERMQEVIHQNHLDHALKVLWQKISPCTLQHFTPGQIRKCMADGTNRTLQTVDELDLSGRNLKVIPPEIKYLRGLEKLSLANNQIKFIPPEIENLTELNTLFLRNNQIEFIPPQIGALTKLETLALSNNKVTAIPLQILDLTSLGFLFLERNRIENIHPSVREYLGRLRFHFLIGNPIARPLQESKTLDLSNSQTKVLSLNSGV